MTINSPDHIQAQLERILESEGFSSSRRLCQFLRYVVEQTLQGHANEIKQYTVGVEAMGFPTTFDPQANPTVRIHARKLRRELDRYYLTQGIQDPIRIDILKGGYVPVFSENFVSSSAADSDQCETPDHVKAPDNGSKPTIAVMMIDCLSGKDSYGHYATGLTEEILIALAKFPEFLVVGPLSKELCLRKGMDTRSIGRQYGVRFVLNCSLSVSGENLRLAARLEDANNGGQIWGLTLDQRLNDIGLQLFLDDIVSRIVAVIADSHGVIPSILTNESINQSTQNLDVYEAILYYYHYFRFLSEDSYVRAMSALEDAVKRYPDHALATAALGDLVLSTYLLGYDDDPSKIERSEALGRKAVALDASCQVAHFTMALVHFLKFEKSLFLVEAEKALELNPNNAIYVAAIAMHIGMTGDWERASELMGRAMRLNPHHPGWYHMVHFMEHYSKGQYDSALIEARRFNSPVLFWDPLIRAAVLGQLGRSMEAKTAVNELLALIPDFQKRGPNLIRRLAYTDDHVEILVDGLGKAGLEF